MTVPGWITEAAYAFNDAVPDGPRSGVSKLLERHVYRSAAPFLADADKCAREIRRLHYANCPRDNTLAECPRKVCRAAARILEGANRG